MSSWPLRFVLERKFAFCVHTDGWSTECLGLYCPGPGLLELISWALLDVLLKGTDGPLAPLLVGVLIVYALGAGRPVF